MPASDEHDYYAILGVQRCATAQEIKRAYHRLAKQRHPDKVHDNAEQTHYAFTELNQAYQTLGDETRRKDYDRTHHNPNPEDVRCMLWCAWLFDLYDHVCGRH